MKVKFLHIPKTAGTSVRWFLRRFFSERHICPALDNGQLRALTAGQVRSYRLFSGHFDWTLLDPVEGPCFTFSVLRPPVDRLVSYYFWLRAEAAKLEPDRLAMPDKRGYRAALVWSPDAFFCGGDSPEVRNHLDDLFDNFYAYYFAGRTFNARRRLQGRGRVSDGELLAAAGRNLDLLDGLYSTGDLAPLQRDIVAACGGGGGMGLWGTLRARLAPLRDIKLNTGQEGHLSSRIAQLEALGATQRSFDRIEAMTRLDSAIWTARFPQAPL